MLELHPTEGSEMTIKDPKPRQYMKEPSYNEIPATVGSTRTIFSVPSARNYGTPRKGVKNFMKKLMPLSKMKSTRIIPRSLKDSHI